MLIQYLTKENDKLIELTHFRFMILEDENLNLVLLIIEDTPSKGYVITFSKYLKISVVVQVVNTIFEGYTNELSTIMV